MTLTTGERDRLNRALDTYVQETPPAPAWGSWVAAPRRSRRAVSGPVVAVASAVLVIGLIGGVAAILRGTGPGPSPVAPDVTETWDDWYERIVASGELNGRDPTIVQGAVVTEPGFDTDSLGVKQTIEPVSQQVGEVDWNALVGDHGLVDRGTFVATGRVGTSVAGVVRARQAQDGGTLVDHGVCLIVATEQGSGDWASGLACRASGGGVSFDTGADVSPLWVSLHRADDAFAVAVPPDGIAVAIDTGTQRYWQVPRGGVALFSGDLGDEIAYVIYGESGDELASGIVQPAEAFDPATLLAEIEAGTGIDLEGSDADVAVDASQALEAVDTQYDLDTLAAREVNAIQVELVTAPADPALTPGQQMYVVYATGLERIEYGPLTEDGTPAEIIITRAAFFVDANTGELIHSVWWE